MNNFTFLRYKKRLSSNRQKEDSLTLIICLELIYNFWISSGNNPVAFWIVSVSNPIDFRFRAISIHPSIFPSMRPSNFTPSTRHFVSWWHSGVRHKHSVLQETYYNKSVFYELPSNREPGCQNGWQPVFRYSIHSSKGVTATLLNSFTRIRKYSGKIPAGSLWTRASFSFVVTSSDLRCVLQWSYSVHDINNHFLFRCRSTEC